MAMYQIECAYTCHTGNIRANNEDNFWCFGESLPVNNEGTKGICSKIISGNRVPAMAVFDGMGGESCGEIAAFLASEEFGKFYNANKRMLSHKNRDEVWIVISGEGKTIVDGMEQMVKSGDVITMSAGCRHTVIADTELKLIEVQLGADINVHDKQKFELEQ